MKLTGILFALLLQLIAHGQSTKAYKSGPRILTFAEQEYGRAQVKVKSGSYTLVAYTPDSIFSMEYGVDDVHPLYTFRGDLRLNRAACDSIIISSNDTDVVIQVKDNGNGITESIERKIFEPRFTTKTSGMGLGLPMIKNIIETYNGSISFSTLIGEGSEFTVQFPKHS